MIEFKTCLNVDSSDYVSPSGTKYLSKYKMVIDEKTGYEHVVKTKDTTNVYQRIQADAPSTDINVLMERFALGETSAIDVREGFYADVTGMPKTYAELFQMGEDCKTYFDELPTDLKEMFNNSYTEFWSEFDSQSKAFNKKIDEYNKRFELSPEYDEPINEKVSKKTDTKESEVE